MVRDINSRALAGIRRDALLRAEWASAHDTLMRGEDARITTACWTHALLNSRNKLNRDGQAYTIDGTKIGPGVYQLTLRNTRSL